MFGESNPNECQYASRRSVQSAYIQLFVFGDNNLNECYVGGPMEIMIFDQICSVVYSDEYVRIVYINDIQLWPRSNPLRDTCYQDSLNNFCGMADE